MKLTAAAYDGFNCLLRRLSSDSGGCSSEKWKHYTASVQPHPLSSLCPKLHECLSNQQVICLWVASDVPDADTVEEQHESSPLDTTSLSDEPTEEYGGSPLKLQSLVDYRELDAALRSRTAPSSSVTAEPWLRRRGLPAAEARELIAVYGRLVHADRQTKASVDLLPLWIACDSSEAGYLALLGMEPTREHDKGGTISYTVTVQSVTRQDLDEMTAGRIVDRYSWLCENATDISTEVFCQYTIDASSEEHALTCAAVPACRIVLEAVWTKPACALQKPPPDAKCSLRLLPVHGDTRSPAHHLYTELQLLKALLAYMQGHSTKWPVTPGTEPQPVSEKIQQLLQAESHFNWAATEGNPSSGIGEPDDRSLGPMQRVSQFHIESRPEMDFCDRLWTVLKACTSNEELFECLNEVERSLRSCTSPPMVYHSAESTVGLWILDLHTGHRRALAGLLDTGSTRPVLLLLELGIDKLRRDYLSAYAAKGLMPGSQLQSLLSSRDRWLSEKSAAATGSASAVQAGVAALSSAVILRIQQQLHRLEVLQYALEATAALAIHAQLSDGILRSVARTALDCYSSDSALFRQQEAAPKVSAAGDIVAARDSDSWLTFPIHTDDMSKLLSRLTPEVWCERLGLDGSKNDWFLLHYCQAPHFDHVMQQKLGDEEEELYYCLEAITTVNVM